MRIANMGCRQKEKEQDMVEAWHARREALMSASGFFDSASRSWVVFSNRPSMQKKINRFASKLLSALYRQMDDYSGRRSLLLSDRSEPYGQFQEILDYLKDTGIIKNVSIGNCFNDAPFFYQLRLSPFFPPGSTDGIKKDGNIGNGSSQDLATAFSRAIGELLERYFLCLYFKKDFIYGSRQDLKNKKNPTLDLKTLAGFADWQKERNPQFCFDESSIFCWEKVRRFSDGRPVYFPAQLLHWNYLYERDEPRLGEPNTNGAGGWSSLEGAILSGLYEIIQRDGFLIYWLNKLTPSKVDPATVPDEKFQELLAAAVRYNFKIHCLNITSEIGIPAFVAVVEDSSGLPPRFSLGGGCSVDPVKALHRALEEAWSVYFWLRAHGRIKTLDTSYRPFISPMSRTDRLTFWANPESVQHYQFFLSGQTVSFSDLEFNLPRRLSSQKKEVEEVISLIERMGSGYEVYYYQAEHRVLSELGYCTVKVIVPRLVPLYLNEHNAPLGAKRLKEVPVKLGFQPAENWNPWPHPFP